MIKRIIKVCFQIALPLLVSLPIVFIFVILTKIKVFKFRNSAIALSTIPGGVGEMARKLFYKTLLRKVGNSFHIGYGSYIVYDTVTLGDRVTIEEHCVISRCHIGNDVIIASRVSTMSGKNHHYIDDLSKTFYESGGTVKSIILGNNLWIGTHAVIMEDLSSGTVVAAGSVVTKRFASNALIGGVPAKVIRMRGKDNIRSNE